MVASSVERPELLDLAPAICCTRADNTELVAANSNIPLTSATFIGPEFNFSPISEVITITKPGVYLINYSATASSFITGNVAIGLRQDGVALTGSTQSATIGVTESANLSGNYVLEVNNVQTAISVFNAGANATSYNNTVLSIVKVTQ